MTGLTLIENAEVYAPERRGRAAVLVAGGRILRVGEVDRAALERAGVEVEAVDGRGRIVAPGLIDPHEHLLGGSGEDGYASQTPELGVHDIVAHGITTVVGVLGVDTVTKPLAALLGRVKALREAGLGAFAWTGGYTTPPTTLAGSVREDVMLIEEIVGAGELAIADERGCDPSARELARVATDAAVAGRMARKAGRTHLHLGEGEGRLAVVREALCRFHVRPEWFYPTHCQRTDALMDEAIELAAKGAWIDFDTLEEDLPAKLGRYLDAGGDPGRLTISSDASTSGPGTVPAQLRALVRERGRALEDVLPLATTHPAGALRLADRGRIEPGCRADLQLLEAGSLEPTDVMAGGRWLVRDGCVLTRAHADGG